MRASVAAALGPGSRAEQARPAGSRRRRRDWPRPRSRATLERLLERGAVDDVEAEQLLLGLGKGAVDHQGRVAVLAQGGGRGGRHQPRDGAELPALRELLLHHVELGHDGVVLLLAPGEDDVFVVVAEDGVEHGGAFLNPRTKEDQPWPQRGKILRPGRVFMIRNLQHFASRARRRGGQCFYRDLRPGSEGRGIACAALCGRAQDQAPLSEGPSGAGITSASAPMRRSASAKARLEAGGSACSIRRGRSMPDGLGFTIRRQSG